MTVKDYVLNEKQKIKEEILTMNRKPLLAIVQVNDDPASNSYIKGKLKDLAEVGADERLIKLPVSTSQEELLCAIDALNKDDRVDGFIVQMPLPKQIDEETIKLAVNPNKDVDGFHPLSKLIACTPKGIVDYLTSEGVDFKGKNALVIGRSNIVGKPMAKLLLSKNCNVTVTHSKTKPEDMEFYLRHADIVVIAIGKPEYLDDKYLKPSAIVVDVGINRGENGLVGD